MTSQANQDKKASEELRLITSKILETRDFLVAMVELSKKCGISLEEADIVLTMYRKLGLDKSENSSSIRDNIIEKMALKIEKQNPNLGEDSELKR